MNANAFTSMRFRSAPDWIATLSNRHPEAMYRVCSLFVVVFAACLAALAAHIVIDLLGDVMLVRDAYDYESHASRIVALDGAAFGGLAVLWRIVSSTLAAALDTDRPLHSAAAKSVVAGPAWWFVGRVIGLTVLAVAAMGVLDASSAPVDDVADVFGGSLGLGLGVCVAFGLGIGTATLSVLRWIAASHETIVAAVVALLYRLVQIDPSIRANRSNDQAFWLKRSLSPLVRQAGKRAPPPLIA